MKGKDKIKIVLIIVLLGILITLLAWAISTTPSKAQTIETVPGQLIKVYETELPYEYLSDEGRRYVRICFLGNVHEYDVPWNWIDYFFRLALADDEMFNEVVLLVAYLSLERNQLIFFCIREYWLVHIKPAI